MVALMAAARTFVDSNVNIDAFKRHVMFTFFNGEAWGYAGSQRFVKDIISWECVKPAESDDQCQQPYKTSRRFERININKISHVIHLTQGAPTCLPRVRAEAAVSFVSFQSMS